MYVLTPHTHHAGYLDARTGGERSQHVEADFQSCTHCQTAINLQEWKDDGAFCGKCMAPVCGSGTCGAYFAEHGCRPYIKFLEQVVGSDYQLAQFRRLAGLDAPPADYQPKIITGA